MEDRPRETLNADGGLIHEQTVGGQLNIIFDAFTFLIGPAEYRRIEGRCGSVCRHDLPKEHGVRGRWLGMGECHDQADQKSTQIKAFHHDLELSYG